MSLTLYHFTARRFVDAIRSDGLTRGCVPLSIEPPQGDWSWRWLTTNGDWKQEWAEGTGRLPYRRDEARLTIEVPDDQAHRVLKWRTVGPLITPAFNMLSAYGDPLNWRLIRGDVPAAWIVEAVDNPALIGAAA